MFSSIFWLLWLIVFPFGAVNRDTILRLMVRVGRHCYLLMDQHIRSVECEVLQCDELWTYVGKKDRRIRADEPAEDIGSQYIFVGMDAETKLVPAFEIGKRTLSTVTSFMLELRRRVKGRPTIITDASSPTCRRSRSASARTLTTQCSSRPTTKATCRCERGTRRHIRSNARLW